MFEKFDIIIFNFLTEILGKSGHNNVVKLKKSKVVKDKLIGIFNINILYKFERKKILLIGLFE